MCCRDKLNEYETWSVKSALVPGVDGMSKKLVRSVVLEYGDDDW